MELLVVSPHLKSTNYLTSLFNMLKIENGILLMYRLTLKVCIHC